MTTELVIALLLSGASFTSGSAAQSPSCFAGLDVYGDWRRSTLPSGGSDQMLEAELAKWAPRVQQLPNPFTRLVVMDSTQLDAAQERRLWLDSMVMVIVDKFAPTPELLVTPRDTTMFPDKAGSMLVNQVTRVAAAAAEAMLHADKRSCAASSARIFINPPSGLSVRQLHVHVVPQPPIVVSNPRAYFAEVEKRLRILLQRP